MATVNPANASVRQSFASWPSRQAVTILGVKYDQNRSAWGFVTARIIAYLPHMRVDLIRQSHTSNDAWDWRPRHKKSATVTAC